MKLLKLFTSLLVCLFSGIALNAQSLQIPDISTIPYIFQGEITSVRVFAGDAEGNELPQGTYHLTDGSGAIAYSVATVRICKILRGSDKIVHGTIQVITTNPDVVLYPAKDANGNDITGYAYFPSVSHGGFKSPFIHTNTVGTKAIFFAADSKVQNSNGLYDNALTIEPTTFGIIFNKNWVQIEQEPLAFAWGFGKVFYSEQEVINFITQLNNIDISSVNLCEETFTNEETTEPGITYQQRLDNYQTWIDFKQSFQPQINPNRDVNAVALELELANPFLSGNATTKYLEFDILVYASDNTTYFDNCLIRLAYGGGAFGTNVVANNNITITRGPLYNNATYTDPNTDMIDQTPTVVGIPMGSDFNQSSWNRTAVTIFPEVLMHIKMEIQNCNQLMGINFTDISFTPIFSFYTTTATADIFDAVSYDLTNYYGQINDASCVPIITSFTDYVPAGTGSLITITGNYFGQHPGTLGTVRFKNADAGNVYPPLTGSKQGGTEDYDTVSWSDDEIVIRIPGVIGDVPDPGNPSTNIDPIPGSGKFQVINFTNFKTESPYALTIPYAVFEGIESFPIYRKVHAQLTDKNNAGGYTVHCNPNLESNFPGGRDAVRKAMRDWSCATGINWTLGGDTALGQASDSICVVSVATLNPGVLQVTNRQIVFCPSSNPREYYLLSFDIRISDNYSWETDTIGSIPFGVYDFYHAVAHELGHAHLLSHINDSLTNLMWWNAGSGPIAEISRKRVWNSYTAMDGGQWVTSNLISGIALCTPVHVLSYPSPASCLGIGIEEADGGFQITTFPNPTSADYITIQFTLTNPANIRYILYNKLGQVLKLTTGIPIVGTIKENLYIGDLASGTYFIQVMINDEPFAIKLIKN